MASPEGAPAFPALTAEYIAARTGFQLVATYPADTHDNPSARRDFLTHKSTLESEYGKPSVTSSWFIDNEEVLLGIFVRHTTEGPFKSDPTRARTADSKGGHVAVWSVLNTRNRNDHM